MRRTLRRGGLAAIAAGVLAVLPACRTPQGSKPPPSPSSTATPLSAPPSPTETATPSTAPSPTPTVRGMPVQTTPASSLYDRTPGVLQEEKGVPGKPTATKTPTPHRP